MTPEEKEKLDLMMAEFFYSCNIPFNVANSIYFKKFLAGLRPAYISPNRLQLSGKLLDKVQGKIESRKFASVDKTGKQMTLLVDGWQNSASNRHNIVFMLATADDHKIFLESMDFSSTRETGQNVFEAVKHAIDLAKTRYDAEVYAIVSDNASTMLNMGNHAKSMGLFFSTCNAHSANLLAGDVLQKQKNMTIMKKVMRVQRDFKRTGLEDRLLNAGGRKPVFFCKTRWTSQRNACESFVKNLSPMKTVTAACDADAESDRNATRPDTRVSGLLFNSRFVDSVNNLLEILNPVAELTNYCQKSTSSAADAVEKWAELLATENHELRECVEYRCTKSKIFNIVTMTANYFHPIYRGKKLNQDQQKEVKTSIFELLDADGLESLRMFTANEGTFATLQKKKVTSPKTFWHYAGEQGHQQLANFAMKMLKIPASTAQLERLFSNWSFIHNDIRNRLAVETSKKLVNIYFTLRSTDTIEDEDEDEAYYGDVEDTDDDSDS